MLPRLPLDDVWYFWWVNVEARWNLFFEFEVKWAFLPSVSSINSCGASIELLLRKSCGFVRPLGWYFETFPPLTINPFFDNLSAVVKVTAWDLDWIFLINSLHFAASSLFLLRISSNIWSSVIFAVLSIMSASSSPW